MKIKYNEYVSSKFSNLIGKNSLLFDTNTGLLCYKKNKIEVLPNQNGNLIKLKKILEEYLLSDNGDIPSKLQTKYVTPIDKQINISRKQKRKHDLIKNKTQKRFSFW